MKISIEVDVEESATNTVSYETEAGQRGSVSSNGPVAILNVNRPACLFLAKLFGQLAHGKFSPGFHLHFGEDLDPEKQEQLRIVLSGD